MKGLKNATVLVLTGLFVALFTALPSFAATNKGVRVNAEYSAVTKFEDGGDSICFGATQKQKCKATKSMKLSCDLYIPTGAVKKDMFFSIDPMAGMGIGNTWYTLYGKYKVQLELDKKGNPILYKQGDKGVEGKINSSIASVKKRSGFYVVSLKKIPLCSWAFEGTPDNKLEINTKENVNISTYVRVERVCKTKWSGYMFIDNLTIYAGKTLKMTFDKKDYKDMVAYRFDDKKVTARVKEIKK